MKETRTEVVTDVILHRRYSVIRKYVQYAFITVGDQVCGLIRIQVVEYVLGEHRDHLVPSINIL